MKNKWTFGLGLCLVLSLPTRLVLASLPCERLPSHATLKATLQAVVSESNGGLGFPMWATVVNRDGLVCAVTFSGDNRGDQLPAARLISAEKANTTNAFSIPGFTFSTANLFSLVQAGQGAFGAQFSSPVNPAVAYEGPPSKYGRADDPMVGGQIGGIVVFGGGLALYDADGRVVGGLGASGDTACTDHIIAWKIRHALNLDNVPFGVSPTGDDNIIHDLTVDPVTGHTVSSGGSGHPICDGGATAIAADLPNTHPVGPDL
jgi:uncharacterized protein GlcG (DUF336 family)